MKKETEELIDQYGKIFKSHFPMYPLGEMEEDDLQNAIKNCISQKKTVYELGYLPDPSDTILRYY